MKIALAVAITTLSAVGSFFPASAQEFASAGNRNGNNGNGNGNGGIRGAPMPLIAGGIPGALVLGGAYLVVRRRRSKD